MKSLAIKAHMLMIQKRAELQGDRGATAVEYGLLVALIAVVIIVAVALPRHQPAATPSTRSRRPSDALTSDYVKAFMARWRTRLRGSRAERGAAAVEFAIVLTVLLLIILGIIDFGRLLFVSQAVKSASREGARVGVSCDERRHPTTAEQCSEPPDDAAAPRPALAGATMQPTGAAAPAAATASRQSATAPRLGCARAADSLTVTVTVDFTVAHAGRRSSGAVGAGLTGTKPVSSTTTMRCE